MNDLLVGALATAVVGTRQVDQLRTTTVQVTMMKTPAVSLVISWQYWASACKDPDHPVTADPVIDTGVKEVPQSND